MTDRCTRTDYPDGAYCIDCVETPYIEAQPPYLEEIITRAWDSGGNLIEAREDACFLEYEPDAGTDGSFFGLYNAALARDVRNPTTLEAAWYVFMRGTVMFAAPYRNGVILRDATGVSSANTLRVEHVGNRADFFIDGVHWATCTLSFTGTTRAGACIYTSGNIVQ